MSLITEDGTGLEDAESYCDVGDADEYHLARGREETWVDLDEDVKEQLLRRATDYMVQAYRQKWAGLRVSDIQSLDWPRYDVPRKDSLGTSWYPADAVPAEVRKACAELAFKAIGTDLLEDRTQPVKREKVGPIEVEYADGSMSGNTYRSIDMMLSPLLRVNGNGIRLTRG